MSNDTTDSDAETWNDPTPDETNGSPGTLAGFIAGAQLFVLTWYFFATSRPLMSLLTMTILAVFVTMWQVVR